jgi:hypothetical protein
MAVFATDDEPEKGKGFPFTISASHTNPMVLYESTKRIIERADIILPCNEVEALIGKMAV